MVDNFIILYSDEDDDEEEYEILDIIDYNDKQYAILALADDYLEIETREPFIVEIGLVDDEIDCLEFEVSEQDLEIIYSIFMEQNKDNYDFVE